MYRMATCVNNEYEHCIVNMMKIETMNYIRSHCSPAKTNWGGGGKGNEIYVRFVVIRSIKQFIKEIGVIMRVFLFG